jgi:hypothetical protein
MVFFCAFKAYRFSVAALAITQQPFAQVVFKQRSLDTEYNVDLIHGAKTVLEKASQVQAVISDEETWKSAKPLDGEKVSFEQNRNRAIFKDLKINVSTRMTPIYLKFICNVTQKGKPALVPVTSTLSNPIIVITNESQWGEAAGKLLMLELFPDKVHLNQHRVSF